MSDFKKCPICGAFKIVRADARTCGSARCRKAEYRRRKKENDKIKPR